MLQCQCVYEYVGQLMMHVQDTTLKGRNIHQLKDVGTLPLMNSENRLDNNLTYKINTKCFKPSLWNDLKL